MLVVLMFLVRSDVSGLIARMARVMAGKRYRAIVGALANDLLLKCLVIGAMG